VRQEIEDSIGLDTSDVYATISAKSGLGVPMLVLEAIITRLAAPRR
jgi:translation elongation factor EF-4